ncbi:MAG TPA: dihydropteroate synthase [Syntrophomonadaceae bacterium]|nr:dihydropteroate synthase [Syntrophomonadaceae bacterium]
MQGHRAVFINNQREARLYLEEIGVDPGAYPYLLPKAQYRCLKLKNISCPAAVIIKQEMLSKGGEAAIKRNALTFTGETDVLLMGTLKHYDLLVEKLRVQPFGLKSLARDIENILENLEEENWSIALPGGRTLELQQRTLIMGILNVTPDSFSDGGRYLDPIDAVTRGIQMAEEGADIIDIGGASSRPDAKLADQEEERKRLLPVVKSLVAENLLVSVDTFRADIARECLEMGAHIINDIGSLRMDSGLIDVLSEYKAPLVVMHNRMQLDRGQPYQDLVADIINDLRETMNRAQEAGIPENCLIVDPGLGFGKTPEQNRILVKHLGEFKSLGRPILIGASRKRFIGTTLNLDTDERLEGSLAVLSMAVMNGASIVRVHDVKESKRVVDMIDAVRNENG